MRGTVFTSGGLSFTASNSAAMKPKVSCNSSFCFLFICVTHFVNSKCKDLTFSSLQANIGATTKVPAPIYMALILNIALVPINLTFPTLHASLSQISCFPPTWKQFLSFAKRPIFRSRLQCNFQKEIARKKLQPGYTVCRQNLPIKNCQHIQSF